MSRWTRTRSFAAVAMLAALLLPAPAAAQVTTASLRGTVTDSTGNLLENVRIEATHQPSGTRYVGITRADGHFTLPGLRVGGPYSVAALRIGFARQDRNGIDLKLGVATDVNFVMAQALTRLATTTVVADGGQISSTRTGAATSVPREALDALPTISRNVSDFTRLTPQSSGNSFAGQDRRLNNITVDGSAFNNSFGLGGQPGERTGVSPISLDAIEQVQVNIAPYDVRQGNFVGAGVNTVTRSGTNQFSGSVYYFGRNESFVGKQAGDNAFNPGSFSYGQLGFRLAGPILRNRLFFFTSYEDDGLKQPGTTFLANTGSQTPGGNVTRVNGSTLDSLSNFLATNFNYQTGPYTGYQLKTPSTRGLAKLDFAVNDHNKLSLRYVLLNSETDVLASNSSSLGFGSRRSNTNSLTFQNSNYRVKENIRSLVGEWNSILGGGRMANNLILGYTSQDESRGDRGSFFPLVDILQNGSTFTSFGYEPFTPKNELRYKTAQIQNNFTIYGDRNDLTFGVSAEQYRSENSFFPGSQSVYTYNSLADFYADANDLIANPNRTTSPVTLRRFQVRYSNIPGQDKPLQPLEVTYGGVYAQDEFRATPDLRFTLGMRVDVPRFGKTGFVNTQVDSLTFRDETGAAAKYSTSQLPKSNPLYSPRLGMNWDATGTGATQVRGGTGVFTGRPAYVWISNQLGENGVLTGFEQLDNTKARPFSPNPDTYKPATVTGAPARSYGLAFTDPSFRFPQVWRSNIAVDQRLPYGFVGTAEFIYDRDVNGVAYINANLPASTTNFTGADDRPRFTSNRINPNITSAIVLKNQNVGRAWNAAASLERAFQGGFFAKAAYSYGESKRPVDPGFIAFGSFINNPSVRDPNNPGSGFATTSPGHRFFTALSYKREYFGFGATGASLFFEGRTGGNGSYVFSGDLNGDGGFNNDLLYVPRDVSEMNFETYTTPGSSGRTFTAAEQATAFEAFIRQDSYLRSRRGQYTERGALFLPLVYNADLSVTQDLFRSISGKQSRVQLRLDVLNFGNLLSDKWGVGRRLVTTSPLIARPAGTDGQTKYRLRNVGNELLSRSFERTAGINDVWRIQLGARYTFN